MWVDDVILLQTEFKNALDDESIDKDVRHAFLVEPELYWSKTVEEFANKYGFSDETGTQDRYIIGTIAAARYSMKTIRDLLTPRDPERKALISQFYETMEQAKFCRKKKVKQIDGAVEEKIESCDRGDADLMVGLFLNLCQQMYTSDKDVYKETYENLLVAFRENVSEVINQLRSNKVYRTAEIVQIEDTLLKNLPKTLIYKSTK